MKKRKTSFSVFDQKRAAEEVRILQERCGFPSDEDFIHALDCDYIEGLDYGRHDVKIANRIYSYNKGAAKRRFKYPRKGIKMDRTTEDIAAPVPPEIMKHYKDIYLDIDIANKIYGYSKGAAMDGHPIKITHIENFHIHYVYIRVKFI